MPSQAQSWKTTPVIVPVFGGQNTPKLTLEVCPAVTATVRAALLLLDEHNCWLVRVTVYEQPPVKDEKTTTPFPEVVP